MPAPSIAECRRLLETCPRSQVAELLASFDSDPRSGVRDLASAYRRRESAADAERQRLDRLAQRQMQLHRAGYAVVAGVDEVGRGALAGPLTVAAVILASETRIPLLDDSKRLSPERRESVAAEVHAAAVAVSIVHVEAPEIDRIGIANAVRLGMGRALAALPVQPDHTLVDGNDARLAFPATAVIGGDRLCSCIAAASVVAKVCRDSIMRAYSDEYPAFDFAVNKGYGTLEHIAAIAELGPTPLHRRSFAPCSQGPLFR